MIRKRIISLFLLCLFLAVNGHNTFRHTHFESEENTIALLHTQGHHHSHSDHHHHHHGQEALSFFQWLQQLMEDFEHSDLGENHLEVFIGAKNRYSLSPMAKGFPLYPFYSRSLFQGAELFECKKEAVPGERLSFSDPPFLDSSTSRGPPFFS